MATNLSLVASADTCGYLADNGTVRTLEHILMFGVPEAGSTDLLHSTSVGGRDVCLLRTAVDRHLIGPRGVKNWVCVDIDENPEVFFERVVRMNHEKYFKKEYWEIYEQVCKAEQYESDWAVMQAVYHSQYLAEYLNLTADNMLCYAQQDENYNILCVDGEYHTAEDIRLHKSDIDFFTEVGENGGNAPLIGVLHYLFEVIARYPSIVLNGAQLPSEWAIGTEDYSKFLCTDGNFVSAEEIIKGEKAIMPFLSVRGGQETQDMLCDYVRLSWAHHEYDWALFDICTAFIQKMNAANSGGELILEHSLY